MKWQISLHKLKTIINHNSGQALSEYSLIIAVIGLAMLTTLTIVKWPIVNYINSLLEDLMVLF